MGQSYFSELVSATPTRVWVNNPTTEEIGLALAQGAVGCTTNPAFGGGLLRRAPDQVRPAVAEAVRALPGAPVSTVAELVQAKLAGRVAERFLPLFETSGGHAGFVSLQGAPAADTDGEHIWAAAEEARALAPTWSLESRPRSRGWWPSTGWLSRAGR